MHDLLLRLQRLKMVMTVVVLITIGVGLITLDKRIDTWAVGALLKSVPWSELGAILVGTGLLSVWIDQIFRREKEASDELRLRRILQDQAPAMRDAVLEAFAANDEDLARVATPVVLDQIVTNSLALRLDDAQFAAEIYHDIRDQAIGASERWHDASVSVDLSPIAPKTYWTPAKARRAPKLFAVTVRWEYTTVPSNAERRFACLSDRSEYRELAQEREATSVWFINPAGGIDALSQDTFELLQFAVNGEPRPIRRAVRKHGQVYTASVGAEHLAAQQPVTISYTYRTVTTQHGHLLHFDIEQPTRNVRLEFNYGGCGIAHVSVLDLIASVRATRIERTPTSLPSSAIRVELDGWIFPRSGFAFVWVL